MANRRASSFAALAFALFAFADRRALADAYPEDWALAKDEPPREAAEPGFNFTDRPVTLNLMTGFGTPLGLLGVELEANPSPWIALGVGAGTNSEGLQLAVLARARPFHWARPKRALAITFGGALATGPHRTFAFDPLFGSLDHSGEGHLRVGHTFERVYWLQPDVGFELQAKSGFHLLVAQGAAVPIAHSGHHCVREQTGAEAPCDSGPSRSSSVPETLWTLTVLLGHAF